MANDGCISRFLVSIAVLFFVYNLSAQREAAIWYFGNEAGLDFNSGLPIPLLNGRLKTHEGCSSIADRNGNLLFYTDGLTVWDKAHRIMPNGTGLLGHESSTQSAIVVPRSGSNNTQYYIFTTDDPDPEEPTNHGLNYTLVDLTLNNGFGDVVSSEKNIHLITYDTTDQLQRRFKCSEKITAVQHNDESSIWVITHFIDTFFAFEVDDNGVNPTPVTSSTNTLVHVGGYKQNAIGYLKASPDGKKLGVAHSQTSFSEVTGPKTTNKQTGKVLLYDFNTETGQVTNELLLAERLIPYGLEFSEKASKLYTTVNIYAENGTPYGSSLFQFDLTAGNIAASEEEIYTSGTVAGALQLAVDGKIYRAGYPVNGSGTSLSVIHNPEAKGTACNYETNAIYLGGNFAELGLPPFVQSCLVLKLEYHNVCLGDDTEFIITGDAPFESVLWDFGDGHTSTDESPLHRYASPGEYMVSLTKYNNGNASEPLTKQVTIYDTPSVPTDLVEYYQCTETENSEGIGDFNLQLINSTVSFDTDQIINVFYYNDMETAEDDTTNTNALPNRYTNSVEDEILVAKVYNPISQCHSFARVQLKIREAVAIQVPPLSGCDIGGGLGQFDLLYYKGLVLEQFELPIDSSIRFYLDRDDALSGAENYLPDDFISPSTTLYIRIDQESICYGIGQFNLTIEMFELPSPDEVLLCSSNGSDSVILTAGIGGGIAPTYAYAWSTGETSAAITVMTPGSYSVNITNNAGCVTQQTIEVVAVEPPKIKNVSISNDRVRIITQTHGDYEYAIDHIEGPYQDNNVFTGLSSGIKTVFVRDKNNCGVASQEITVIAYPRFFSPNGDSVNDEWHIQEIARQFNLRSPVYIFDRFGTLLAQVDPLTSGWDGTYNGRPLASADYWFRVTLTDGKELTGHFSLKR